MANRERERHGASEAGTGTPRVTRDRILAAIQLTKQGARGAGTSRSQPHITAVDSGCGDDREVLFSSLDFPCVNFFFSVENESHL